MAQAFVYAASGETEQADSLIAEAYAKVDERGMVTAIFALDVADYLITRGRVDEARASLIALRARLIDPLAGRLRNLTDGMLARCEAALTKPA